MKAPFRNSPLLLALLAAAPVLAAVPEGSP